MANDTKRGQQIIQKAMELMKAGKARSWSHAIEEARKATPQTKETT